MKWLPRRKKNPAVVPPVPTRDEIEQRHKVERLELKYRHDQETMDLHFRQQVELAQYDQPPIPPDELDYQRLINQ